MCKIFAIFFLLNVLKVILQDTDQHLSYKLQAVLFMFM